MVMLEDRDYDNVSLNSMIARLRRIMYFHDPLSTSDDACLRLADELKESMNRAATERTPFCKYVCIGSEGTEVTETIPENFKDYARIVQCIVAFDTAPKLAMLNVWVKPACGPQNT